MWSKLRGCISLLLAVALLVPQAWTAPAAQAAAVGDIVLSADFDTGTDGWFKRGSETVVQTTDTAQSGAGSLKVTGRTANWNGPGIYLDSLVPGATYEFSVYAKLLEETPGQATIELTVNQTGLPADDPETYRAIKAETVTADEWVEVKGNFTLDPRAERYQLYAQASDSATVSYYIDTFGVKLLSLPTANPQDPEEEEDRTVLYQDFEDGDTGGWAPLSWGGSGSVSITSEQASSGGHSLLFSGRATQTASPSINVISYLQQDRIYDISLKVRLGEGSDSVHVTSKTGDQFDWIMSNQTVTDTAWTTFAATGYTLPPGAGELLLFVETTSSTADIYIDEFVITDVTPGQTEPEPDPDSLDQTGITSDFEDGIGNWTRRNGAGGIAVSDADNYTPGGSWSLLTTAAAQYDGPILDVLGKMHRNYQYDLSAWVKMAPGEAPTRLRISVQSGPSTFTNVSANVTVTDAEWVQLTGRFTLRTTPAVLNAYVETADDNGGPRTFYMDDFALTYAGPIEGTLPVQTELDNLKDLYADYFEIGAAVEPDKFSGTNDQLLKKHYNSIVAENSMKPSSINGTPGTYNYAGADAIAQYAQDNGMTLRFHTLLWHQQGSDWMLQDEQGNWLEPNETNKELVLSRLREYISTVVTKYADVSDYYDVVNEVIDESRPDGMRDSHWYRITGLDFIRVAFEEAHQADPTAKLYINDYSTHNPQKRDFLFNLATQLRDEGVPIHGIGHQTHINVSGPSIQQISDSIRKFGEAGFDNQLTELDISVYTNNNTAYDPIPEEILIRQGYRYKELFEELVRLDEMGRNADSDTPAYNPDGWISNVTIWGIADDHTWLHNRGTTRQDAPFPFDKRHQAKYAYWGMVEAVKEVVPSKLPMVTKAGNAAKGIPTVDGHVDAVWHTVPALETERTTAFGASFRTLWDENHLYVLADIQDSVKTEEDKIEFFIQEGSVIRSYEISRNAGHNVVEKAGGYVVEIAIPLNGNEIGKQVSFDLRITTGGTQDGSEHGQNGAILSWSDPRGIQHQDTSGYGTLTLVAAPKSAQAVKGTPVIDAEEDEAWEKAVELETAVWVEGTSGSTAKFKTMWDEQNLYVYALVTDALLSDASANAWEQDSVEIFVDQNNGKTTSYQSDDGQYRISFNNVKTVGGHAAQDNYTSATRIVPGVGYAVEAAIALDTIEPAEGTVIGFDFQVNNDEDGNGTRDSVVNWADPSGQSYQDTSGFGVLRFVIDPVPPPAAPANVTIASRSYNSLEVKWDAVDRAAGYNVYRAVNEDGPYAKRNDSVVRSLSYSDANLAALTTYYYKVASVDEQGNETGLSAAVSLRTGSAPTTGNPNGNTGIPNDTDTPSNSTVIPTAASNGRALGTIGHEQLNDALARTNADAAGVRKVAFELRPLSGTSGYAVELPSAALIGNDKFVIAVKTELGVIELPSNMLAGLGISSDSVIVTFGEADLGNANEDVRRQIGNRPAIDLQVLVDNRAIAWKNERAPITVSVPYKPTAEELEAPGKLVVWHVDGNGAATAVPNGRYDAASGTVVFTTTHFSVYAVVYVNKTFADLRQHAWAGAAIEALASRDVVKGVSETAYAPAANIKRADFLLLLVRALELRSDGGSSFSDVAATDYYYDGVRIASALGIAKGDGSGRFHPNAAITRQEMMALAARALEAAGRPLAATGSLDGFADASAVEDYARDSAAALVAAGIVDGIDGELRPSDPLTRAQAAVILYRVLGLE